MAEPGAGSQPPPLERIDQTSITTASRIDTSWFLLIGIGPEDRPRSVPGNQRCLDPGRQRRVLRKMLTTAATVAVPARGPRRAVARLAGLNNRMPVDRRWRDLLFVISVWMVLAPPTDDGRRDAGGGPVRLAQFPLARAYLLNQVGIVGLMTIPGERSRSASSPWSLGCPRVRPAAGRGGVPLGEPGRREAQRRPHAGHREVFGS